MCFSNFFCGCNRHRHHDCDDHRRGDRDRDRDRDKDRDDVFGIRTFVDQDDFCRAVRRCNRRDRDRHHNRRRNCW